MSPSTLLSTGCEYPSGELLASDGNTTGTNDHAQIYAAAIPEIHSLARSTRVVYLVTTTEDLVYAGAPAAPPQKLPAHLQETITAELAAEPYELIWIETFDDAPIDPINPQIAEDWHIAEGDGIILSSMVKILSCRVVRQTRAVE